VKSVQRDLDAGDLDTAGAALAALTPSSSKCS
jgi:hypothetical protein